MKLINKINSMSRRKQAVLYTLILIIFCIYCVLANGPIYTSPEAVLFACEKGLHYGPSEKILHIERQGKNALVIGECEDGLSAVPAKKNIWGFWNLGFGDGGSYVDGYIEANGVCAEYDERFDIAFGKSNIEDVKEVRVIIGDWEEGSPKVFYEFICETDSEGFFVYDLAGKINYDTLYTWPHALEIEGYNDKGESIFFTSFIRVQEFDSDGNLIYSSL